MRRIIERNRDGRDTGNYGTEREENRERRISDVPYPEDPNGPDRGKHRRVYVQNTPSGTIHEGFNSYKFRDNNGNWSNVHEDDGRIRFENGRYLGGVEGTDGWTRPVLDHSNDERNSRYSRAYRKVVAQKRGTK